jgi:hypothetical protein
MSRASLIQPFLATILLVLGPCSESLPPLAEPREYLTASISGQYVLSATDNSVKVFFSVKNAFDETLQDQAALSGSMEIVSARNPGIRKTFPLSSINLLSQRSYNAASGTLTLNAGDTLVFLVSWDFSSDDDSVDVRRDFFRYVKDLACDNPPLAQGVSRCLALTEEFVLRAQVTIFKERAPVNATVTFPLCFVSRWVNPKFCPPIITIPSCFEKPREGSLSCTPTDFNPQ